VLGLFVCCVVWEKSGFLVGLGFDVFLMNCWWCFYDLLGEVLLVY